MGTNLFNLSKNELEKILEENMDSVRKKANEVGVVPAYGDEHGVYKLHPDGWKEYIKIYKKEDDDIWETKDL